MWAQEYLLGDGTRARPSLVLCQDQDVGSGLCEGNMKKGRTRRGSVQVPRGRLRRIVGA